MPSQNSRVLVFSQRNATKRAPFRCAHFEFEDVIAEIDSAEIVAPTLHLQTQRSVIAKQLAYHTPVIFNPGIRRQNFTKDYDLFVAICGDPSDLLAVTALGNWRDRCKNAVCIIDELWVRQMPAYKNYLHMLRKFDLVCLYYSQSVDALNSIIGPRCVYLPPAVDTIRFSPLPDLPQRVVDVYSMGRRSATTHESLAKLAAQKKLFYVYDTTSADKVLDPVEHRELYANTLKRSRYFIVNPGLIDRPDVRGSQIEIGYRYFDGIAAGAINIGTRPANAVFPKLFDWPSPMIDLPYDSGDFEKITAELEESPDAVEQMRRTNVRQALLRHDWTYRWEAVLKAVGMEPLPQIAGRKARLQELAELALPGSALPIPVQRESRIHAMSVANREVRSSS